MFQYPADVIGLSLAEENALLHEWARDRVVLEVGTLRGRTAISMAQSAVQVHCVDTFVPLSWERPELGQGPDLDGFLQAAERYGVRAKIVTHQGRSQEVLKTALSWPHFGFAFIDGDHTYEGVRGDISLVEPLLLPGSWVAFHDYDEFREVRPYPGVKQAVDEWRGQRPFEVHYGLARVRV